MEKFNKNSITENVKSFYDKFKFFVGSKTGRDQPTQEMSRAEMLVELGIPVEDYRKYVGTRILGVSKLEPQKTLPEVQEANSAKEHVPNQLNNFITKLVRAFKSSKNSNRNKYKYTDLETHKQNIIKSIHGDDFVSAAKYCMYADYVANHKVKPAISQEN